MKKLSSAVIVIMLMTLCGSFSFAAPAVVEKPAARLVVDARSTVLKDKPVLIGQKLYMKVKALAVNIGIKDDKNSIVIDSSKKQYTLVQGSNKAVLKLNDKKAVMNGKAVTLDSAPILYKNNVYLPADTVAKLFGKKAVWDEASGTVAICSNASFTLVKDIMDKSDKAMASARYKSATAINVNIGDTVKRIVKHMTRTDSKAKIEYQITLISQNGATNEAETFTTEKYNYSKTDGIWMKTASKGYSGSIFDGSLFSVEDGNRDFIYTGLAVNTEGTDAIIIEGDIEIQPLFGDIDSDSTYKAHTKITLDKNDYNIKEIKWSSSGSTVINDGKYKYTNNSTAAFTDFNGDFEVKVPEELVQLTETKTKKYESSDLGFALDYPVDWTVEEYADSSANVSFISPLENNKDDFLENVILAVRDSGGVTLEQYGASSLAQIQKEFSGYKLISHEKSLLGGSNAQKIVFTYKNGEYNLKNMYIYTIYGNTLYYLIFTSKADKYDSYINTLEDITESFTIK